MKSKKFFALVFSALMFAMTFMVSCADSPEDTQAPYLEVTPLEIEFSTDGVATNGNTIEIKTNRVWEIQVPETPANFVTLSSLSGEGDATVQVSVPAGATTSTTLTVRITNPTGGTVMKEEVAIMRKGNDPIPTETIYSETVGTDVSKDGEYWPWVNDFTGWDNTTAGMYTGQSASVRNSGTVYDPAEGDGISGAPYVYLNSSAYFMINGVEVASETNFTFKFVALNTVATTVSSAEFAEVTNTTFKLQVSPDGAKWYDAPISTTAKAAGSDWYNVTSEFALPADFGSTKLTFRFIGYTGGSGQSIRFDDFKLYAGGSGAELTPEQAADLPAVTLPTAAVATSFSDNFSTVTSGNAIYTSDNWTFFSNDPAYPDNANMGWKTGVYNDDKYIQSAPFNSTLSQVVAYAVMAPVNVKAAGSKVVSVNRAIYYLTEDASKLEIVASTTATNENARDAATWTTLSDISYAAGSEKNIWNVATVDLAGTEFADAEKVYIALRYTGKSNTYRVDDVKFSDGSTVVTPVVTTADASAITATSATLGGSISVEAASYTEVGVEYVEFSTGVVGDIDWSTATKAAASAVATPWEVAVSGLTADTQYAFRAYATDADATIYGEPKTFVAMASVATAITVTDIVAMTKGDFVDETNNRILTAVVTAAKPAGNYLDNLSFGNLYLQTEGATEPGNAIALRNTTGFNDIEYAVGDKVEVTLVANVAKIGEYNGLKQVEGIVWEQDVKKIGTATVNPIVISASDLVSAAYTGMLVTIKGASPTEAGVWTNGSSNKTNTLVSAGTEFSVYIDKDAVDFVNRQYMAVEGDITGIASEYSSKGQLLPRNGDDVTAFDSTEPFIESVNPTSLLFAKDGGSQDITAIVSNQGSNAITATVTPASAGTATVSGNVVTLTANANTEALSISATLTIAIEGGNSVDVPVTVEGTAPVVTFDLTAPQKPASVGTGAYGHSETVPQVVSDPITIDFTNGSTPTRLWISGEVSEVRAYKGATATISGANIIKVEVVADKPANISLTDAAQGTLTDGIWTGDATSLGLSFSATTKITAIKVTYAE